MRLLTSEQYEKADAHDSITVNVPEEVQQSPAFSDFTPQLLNVDTSNNVSTHAGCKMKPSPFTKVCLQME
jgi:hypothetical protein